MRSLICVWFFATDLRNFIMLGALQNMRSVAHKVRRKTNFLGVMFLRNSHFLNGIEICVSES